MRHHEEFLDACMKESMLFWPKILRRLEKIKMLCLQFVAASARLISAVRDIRTNTECAMVYILRVSNDKPIL
eukprot:1195586-Prorocentrum_minimum.AAC.2